MKRVSLVGTVQASGSRKLDDSEMNGWTAQKERQRGGWSRCLKDRGKDAVSKVPSYIPLEARIFNLPIADFGSLISYLP